VSGHCLGTELIAAVSGHCQELISQPVLESPLTQLPFCFFARFFHLAFCFLQGLLFLHGFYHPAGRFSGGGFSVLMENLSFWGFGRPNGFAPYICERFLGRPGPPRTPERPISIKSINAPSAKHPFLAPPDGA